MQNCILHYNGHCDVKLTVNIHGNILEIPGVLIDTGFTTSTTFGLKLPPEYAQYAYRTAAGTIRQADGNPVAVQYIPDAIIVRIENFELIRQVSIRTFFMTGQAVLGVLFLQRCRINFDGPQQKAIFDFDL